jgi:hypothetical protein
LDGDEVDAMTILALIDDLQITIKLKTAIILAVALVCFLASIVLFLLSWFRVSGQRFRGQDSVADAKGANQDEASAAGEAASTTPTEGVVTASASLESKLEEMNAQLSQTTAYVLELSSQVKAMTVSISDELIFRLQQKEEKRIEEETRWQLEAERQRAVGLEKGKVALRSRLQNRLGELAQQSEILQIAMVTKELLDELPENSIEKVHLVKTFTGYLQAATKAKDWQGKLSRTEPAPESQLQGNQNEIESEFESFEQLIEGLNRDHRPVWFTGLLEESGRYPSLQDKANDLKRLLKLEEVQIETGSVPRDLAEFEVVSADGRGKKPIISEVLENGYRLTETGTVLKRPKVRVHFEA